MLSHVGNYRFFYLFLLWSNLLATYVMYWVLHLCFDPKRHLHSAADFTTLEIVTTLTNNAGKLGCNELQEPVTRIHNSPNLFLDASFGGDGSSLGNPARMVPACYTPRGPLSPPDFRCASIAYILTFVLFFIAGVL
eukprot:3987861-Amphidinium_carterae.1